MANGLSLKVLLQLQKKQFDQGINSVKRSLAGLARSFKALSGMLVGGLGLSSIISRLKDTATQMSVVKATLENTTDSFKEYAETMSYLQDISYRYGQDLMVLTNGFAKFHAAGKQTNLTMEQQKDIFASLTRAAGAYHLSAQRTELVMLAVEQMMSKGVVRSEELRRQLGDSLPGAMQIMARAWADLNGQATVSIADFDAAMRAGEVLSEKVLPVFAQRLEMATKAANFDSLQSSLNRYKNSWAQFVDKLNVESPFKSLVDFGSNTLRSLTVNMQGFKSAVLGAVAGLVEFFAFRKAAEVLKKAFNDIKLAAKGAVSPAVLEVRDLQKELDIVAKKEEALHGTIQKLKKGGKSKSVKLFAEDAAYMDKVFIGSKKIAAERAKGVAELTKGNHVIKQTLSYGEQINLVNQRTNALAQQRVALEAKISKYSKETVAAASTAHMAGAAFGKVLRGILGLLKSAALMAAQIAVAFAVGKLVEYISNLRQARKEMEGLKNEVTNTDAKMSAAVVSTTELIKKAKQLYEIAKDTTRQENERNEAAKKLNELTKGYESSIDNIKSGTQDVTDKINDWADGIMKAARAAAAFSILEERQKTLYGYMADKMMIEMSGKPLKVDIEGEGEVLTKEGRAVEKLNEKIKIAEEAVKSIQNLIDKEGLIDPNAIVKEGDVSAVDQIKASLDKYKKSVKDLDEQLAAGVIGKNAYAKRINGVRLNTKRAIEAVEGWEVAVGELDGEYRDLYSVIDKVKEGGGGSTKDTTPKGKLKDALDDYTESKKALDAQFENGYYSTYEEYFEESAKLAQKTWEQISAFENLEDVLKSLGGEYEDLAAAVKEFGASYKSYMERKTKEGGYDDVEAKIKKIKADFDKIKGKEPKYETPDRTFDYKKTEGEKKDRDADWAEKYAKDFEKIRQELEDLKAEAGKQWTAEMQKELDDVTAKAEGFAETASSWRKAANVSQITEDVKKLKKELTDLRIDNFNNIAQSVHSFSESVINLVDAFAELSGETEKERQEREESLKTYKAIVTVIDELVQMYNTFMAISKMITEVQEKKNQLDAATAALNKQNSQEIIQNKLLEQSVVETSAGVEVGAEQMKQVAIKQTSLAETQSIGKTVGAEAAKQGAIGTTTGMLGGEAVAGAAASQASIPYIGPILAAAAVAAIVALLVSNMNKFATGGIVGGNSYSGDKQTARVNSGEMILNKAQQGHLWNMISGKEGMGGGKVEFVLRGDRLLGAINNYQSKVRG